MEFNTKEGNIDRTCRALREDYLTEGGTYFHGYKLIDIEFNYCPPGRGGIWSGQVAVIMMQIWSDKDKNWD